MKMELKEWHDPLLITDVSSQQQHQDQQQQQLPLSYSFSSFTVSENTMMDDPNCYTPIKIQDQGFNAENVKDPTAESVTEGPFQSLHVSEDPNICTPVKIEDGGGSEESNAENLKDTVAESVINGRELLGFSLTSPDLVICTGSPDIPRQNYGDSPEFSKGCSISLENGIEGSEEFPDATKNEDSCLPAHFELPSPPGLEDNSLDFSEPIASIDVGMTDSLSFNEIELLECSESSPQRNSPEENTDIEELKEAKRQVEELKKENEQKCKECAEALKSLKELQNELLRKSMHVGSLAFAIEGQVKEKTRWFSSLRDVTRKLKILKMDQIKVSEEASSFKQFQAEFADMSSTIQSKLMQQVELHEDLKIKFIKGAKEQKELYNKVLDLKGNIRVFCRCRPLNAEEIAAGASMAIDFEAAKDGELTVKSNGMSRKNFKFDAIFSPQANQAEVFMDTAPLATSVLDGYNVSIFAYGQTGTGKTFTMEGTEESRGVNYRTLEELFNIIEERKNAVRYEISVSVMEVYNEQIRDLLVSGSQQGVKRLEIKQVGEGMHHVPGLVEAHVNNMNEVWEALRTGSNARAVGSTNANEHSSRSHCIHCVMVKGENLLNGECTRSKLWLIDLAGSERIAKTEVQGERLKETQSINRSLSALGDVISALATKSAHIPFRNSKLTHLLQDSLGGDSKTLMFVQISPNENDLSETLCSLNFASRVRGIELGPAKKQVDSMELLKYKQMVEKGKQEMKNKDFQMKKMEDTILGLDIKLKEKDTKHKNLQDKIKELESQLLVERKLARQHVDSKIAEQFRQQNEEQDAAAPPTRPPLVSKTLLAHKTNDENKFPLNITRPFTENNSYKLSTASTAMDFPIKRNDLTEKENNPDIVEQLVVPKRIGRASMCPVSHRTLAATAPRRKTLIPVRDFSVVPKLPPSFLPEEKEEEDDDDGVESKENSPKELKATASKKLGSGLRRSLQKKLYRSPKQQHGRRVGVNVEKVRLSIGGRGRTIMAQRMVHGNAGRRVVPKENQPKQRWNIGGTATTKACL